MIEIRENTVSLGTVFMYELLFMFDRLDFFGPFAGYRIPLEYSIEIQSLLAKVERLENDNFDEFLAVFKQVFNSWFTDCGSETSYLDDYFQFYGYTEEQVKYLEEKFTEVAKRLWTAWIEFKNGTYEFKYIHACDDLYDWGWIETESHKKYQTIFKYGELYDEGYDIPLGEEGYWRLGWY